MRTIILSVLCVVLMSILGSASAVAQDDRVAVEGFIRRIYAEYADSSFNAPQPSLSPEDIFTPAINTKSAEDVAAANGEMPDGPAYGFSWLVVGNDYEDIVLDEVAILAISGDRASVRVRFDNFRPVTLTMTLAKVAAGWRIADIDYGPAQGGTLRGMLGLPLTPAPNRPNRNNEARQRFATGLSALPVAVRGKLDALGDFCEEAGDRGRGDVTTGLLTADLNRDGLADYILPGGYDCPNGISIFGGATASSPPPEATIFLGLSGNSAREVWSGPALTTEILSSAEGPLVHVTWPCPAEGDRRDRNDIPGYQLTNCEGDVLPTGGGDGWEVTRGQSVQTQQQVIGGLDLQTLQGAVTCQADLGASLGDRRPEYQLRMTDGLAAVHMLRDVRLPNGWTLIGLVEDPYLFTPGVTTEAYVRAPTAEVETIADTQRQFRRARDGSLRWTSSEQSLWAIEVPRLMGADEGTHYREVRIQQSDAIGRQVMRVMIYDNGVSRIDCWHPPR